MALCLCFMREFTRIDLPFFLQENDFRFTTENNTILGAPLVFSLSTEFNIRFEFC